jgi:formylglycine-generating enzyme required for sulfatase activity
LLAVAIVSTLGGCAGGSRTPLVPFSQPVAGSTATLEMVPVPARANGGPLWIGATEVTWDLYDVFVYRLDEPADVPLDADALARPSKPYISMDRGFGHAGYPAISMSAHGAAAFCEWLSDLTGRRFRLPTEDEWRSVCGLAAVDEADLADHAWYRATADGTTHPVATKKPDALGLYDLLGNAAEWCTGEDGRPVTMGGSYRDRADGIGCAARVEPSPDWNASDPQLPKSIWWLADAGFVGFRVVCEPASAAGRRRPRQ